MHIWFHIISRSLTTHRSVDLFGEGIEVDTGNLTHLVIETTITCLYNLALSLSEMSLAFTYWSTCSWCARFNAASTRWGMLIRAVFLALFLLTKIAAFSSYHLDWYWNNIDHLHKGNEREWKSFRKEPEYNNVLVKLERIYDIPCILIAAAK